MDQEIRNTLQRATQQIRRLLEDEFAEQLEGTFDILPGGEILPDPGKHLDARQRLARRKLVDAIEHIKASGKTSQEAVDEYTREAAFTFLNRFVALRMLEARGMLQECVSKGDQSSGFKEFGGLAPGLSALTDGGYRLYLECLCDELSVEVKVLFDRRDTASMLWPRRTALTELLGILGQSELAGVWSEDETIGWVYQYFNSGEERKKMREESSAPRNSRELAVRNQFFTPRYVVEFLTDNTLGRIWYEMRKGETRLVEECEYLVRRPSEVFLAAGEEPLAEDVANEQDLRQEELLQKTVYITHRAKKDPRDLKILDPACGSGHFLLYAFDLLISIYEEAWQDEESPASEITGKQLRDDYAELTQLHAALPGLVLACNLHGIDIDPRAAQIAALALWMRGQRAFNECQIARDNRPAVDRSNIVCAEPMPGEAAFLEEFITKHLSADAEGQFLASLVRKVFEAMKLAGEAGSLLKIEEEIAEEVAKAKKQWLERPEFQQQSLFDDAPKTVQKELDLTYGITDESFWGEAEQRIYNALQAYSEHAERSGGFQRRLFAIDAARGFAFIDICRLQFDVVLMNPPFGECPETVADYIGAEYPHHAFNILCAMHASGRSRLAAGGALGAIVDKTVCIKSSYAKYRETQILDEQCSLLNVDLGWSVLDGAQVETWCFAQNDTGGKKSSNWFFDLTNVDRTTLGNALHSVINEPSSKHSIRIFQTTSFLEMPNASLGFYNLSDSMRKLFTSTSTFEPDVAEVRQGLGIGGSWRYFRLVHEAPCQDCWAPLANGGGFAPYFRDIDLKILWRDRGREIKAEQSARYGSASRTVKNQSNYFREGISFPKRTDILNAHVMPSGCIFSVEGMGVFPVSADKSDLALAILNSRLASYLISCYSGQHKQAGYVKQLPAPSKGVEVSDDVNKILKIKRLVATGVETSTSFQEPHWLKEYQDKSKEICTIEQLQLELSKQFNIWKHEIADCRERIDATICQAYELSEADIGFLHAEAPYRDLGLWDGIDDNNESHLAEGIARQVVSYGFGLALGRFMEGRLSEQQVLFGWQPAELRTIRKNSKSVILVDDVGHPCDVALKLEHSIESVVGKPLQKICPDLNQLLGDSQTGTREWLRRDFFSWHEARYSRGRRKAPIYWQLASPSTSYSVWLYFHDLTRDTFFQVLNEYVKPKVNHERQKMDRVRSEAGAEPTRSQRKEIEDQERFVTELAAMAEEIERIAPLWNPNTDDGVIINFAPLWRLVPHNKSWQKECKKVWDKLVQGEYDWAHLAMHLWPERVVPKCASDASLAIAHGLEEVFWQQDDRERFQPKEEPKSGWDSIVEELVEARTSPAVKAALESLLKAPAPAGTTRSRRRRATT
ncbi:BREX-1 system adenine-specific DNA-methyltransferase PglX [Aeoliella sp.]|uniref:BREX-1 system adenine-specific DNA-methyltransferase PglX n=1 Tax=Aeoliella sp. TaxID=2795800 RepID=UPI003CCBB81D